MVRPVTVGQPSIRYGGSWILRNLAEDTVEIRQPTEIGLPVELGRAGYPQRDGMLLHPL
jgi:hypothetical protein